MPDQIPPNRDTPSGKTARDMETPKQGELHNLSIPERFPVPASSEILGRMVPKTVVLKSASRNQRTKASAAWDRHDRESEGRDTLTMTRIASVFPQLTPTQLRVASLVARFLPTSDIAEILCTTEHAVEKVRSRIREKLLLPHDTSLATFLAGLLN